MEDIEPYITEGSKMRDKFLIEAMGLYKEPKWKVIVEYTNGIRDPKVDFRGTEQECEKYIERHKKNNYWGMPHENPVQSKGRVVDFSTWEGFGKLWEWAIEQEWWNWFMNYQSGKMVCFEISYHLIKPNFFADAIYEYMQNDVDKGDK